MLGDVVAVVGAAVGCVVVVGLFFGLAVAVLINNVISVSFLEWLGSPALRPLLAPWLRANGKEGRTVTLVGLVVILAALGLMTFLFSLVKV